MESTAAIVLKCLKYGDSSLISHLFTKKSGKKSFITKGVFNSKKSKLKNLFFPLNELEIAYKLNSKSDLIYLNQTGLNSHYKTLFSNPIKSAVVQFLAEILNESIKEEEQNLGLYEFIIQHLKIYDEKETHFSDFHLIFLKDLTAFLGFYPNSNHSESGTFDLNEGKFSKEKSSHFLLNETENEVWKKLIVQIFTLDSKNIFTQNQRRILLDILMKYYQVHLPGFRIPKSLEVLRVLFE